MWLLQKIANRNFLELSRTLQGAVEFARTANVKRAGPVMTPTNQREASAS